MTSDVYASAMRTVRHCRRKAVRPSGPLHSTAGETREFYAGVLNGMLVLQRHLPLSRRERARLFDALVEASTLIGWLDDIARVLSGGRTPRWIGSAPREVVRWRRTLSEAHKRCSGSGAG